VLNVDRQDDLTNGELRLSTTSAVHDDAVVCTVTRRDRESQVTSGYE
jgi:hypothetical protein